MFIDLRERGKERERERERNIDIRNINWLPPLRTLTWDRTRNLFGAWDDAPLNWATRPGLLICVF